MTRKERIRYYRTFVDDFVETKEQHKSLPEDYKFLREDFFSKIRSALTYSAALLFGVFYCTFHLHTRYKNRRVFKEAKGKGFFIYSNHTQPIGDVVLPAFAAFPRRIYTIVSPSNLGIPFIGKQLPFLGALPIADSLRGMKNFSKAVEHRINQGKIITVFPEAHVWEYCTLIRPYSESSFKYPVKLQKPSYCMTVTYQKRRFGTKPRTTVYIDGPFYPDTKLAPRARATDLRDRIYDCMCRRSKNSSLDYIRYEKRGEEV